MQKPFERFSDRIFRAKDEEGFALELFLLGSRDHIQRSLDKGFPRRNKRRNKRVRFVWFLPSAISLV